MSTLKMGIASRKAMKVVKIAAVAVVGSVGAVAVQAADYTTEINAAGTEGSANVTAVIAAVFGLAILGFGVHAVLGWMKGK